MKKIILIYLIGVILGWHIGFNLIKDTREEYKSNMTYGDVAFVSILSVFSWADVAAICIVKLIKTDFLNTPIKPSK